MKDISDTVFKRIDPNLLRKLSWKKATAMVVCKEEKGNYDMELMYEPLQVIYAHMQHS